MDFHLTEEETALKKEYDDFFREEMKNAPPAILKGGLAAQSSKEGDPFNRYMRKKMVEKGWYVQHWPKEYGGRDASLMEQMIFNESMAYCGAPGIDLQAVKMFGPSLLLYGTEEQKKRLVIPIAKGEVQYAQGWTEPNAGSDLASLKTTAIRDGIERFYSP